MKPICFRTFCFDGEFSARLIELGEADAKCAARRALRVLRGARAAHARAAREAPSATRRSSTKHRLVRSASSRGTCGGFDVRSGSENIAAAVLVALHLRPKKDRFCRPV